jgi:hypothetical protein
LIFGSDRAVEVSSTLRISYRNQWSERNLNDQF